MNIHEGKGKPLSFFFMTYHPNNHIRHTVLGLKYTGFLLNPYLIGTPFNTFANRADPDQAALTA